MSPGACLSSAAALDPGDQAHFGPAVRVLGILVRVLSLLLVAGWATVSRPASGASDVASFTSSVLAGDVVTPPPLEATCPQVGALGKHYFKDSRSSHVAKGRGRPDHLINPCKTTAESLEYTRCWSTCSRI